MTQDRAKFIEAALAYLAFSDEHRHLAKEIAAEAAEQVEQIIGSADSRAGRYPFNEQVRLVVNACIRESYTAYSDLFIEKTLDQPDAFGEPQEDAAVFRSSDEAAQFIERHRS